MSSRRERDQQLCGLWSQVVRRFQRMAFSVWLGGLCKTYGTSFTILVALGYFTQGFRCFPWLPMAYFYKDTLQVDPGTMQFLMSSTGLPMVAKPIYGIISDSVYIRGAHRIPYLIIAGALQLFAWGTVVVYSGASSSASILTAFLTLSNTGAAIADVVYDAIVAEAAKKKKGARQGELQSFAWLAMASGGLLGNLIGGYALKRLKFETMICLYMILLGAQFLVCLLVSEHSFGIGHRKDTDDIQTTGETISGRALEDRTLVLQQSAKTRKKYSKSGYSPEDSGSSAQSLLEPTIEGLTSKSQSRDPATFRQAAQNLESHKGMASRMSQQVLVLAEILQKPEILKPLLWFLSSFAIVPGMGSAIFYYHTEFLRLDPLVIGLAKVVGQMGLLAGSLLYSSSLKLVPLRKMFGTVQVLLSLCMLSDILLVNRVNLKLHIPDAVFVLGASAFVEAIAQFKFLPFTVLLARLCPPGCEGSLFAFCMSAVCLAGLMSGYLGVGLASYLKISANSFTQLPLGIFIQALFALLPVLWIRFIPEDKISLATHHEESVHEKVL